MTMSPRSSDWASKSLSYYEIYSSLFIMYIRVEPGIPNKIKTPLCICLVRVLYSENTSQKENRGETEVESYGMISLRSYSKSVMKLNH